MPEPMLMKLGMYIIATEPISTAYFINPSYRCKATTQLVVSFLSVLGNGSVNTFPRQQKHATVEELLEA
jgi:hypothetical protein